MGSTGSAVWAATDASLSLNCTMTSYAPYGFSEVVTVDCATSAACGGGPALGPSLTFSERSPQLQFDADRWRVTQTLDITVRPTRNNSQLVTLCNVTCRVTSVIFGAAFGATRKLTFPLTVRSGLMPFFSDILRPSGISTVSVNNTRIQTLESTINHVSGNFSLFTSGGINVTLVGGPGPYPWMKDSRGPFFEEGVTVSIGGLTQPTVLFNSTTLK